MNVGLCVTPPDNAAFRSEVSRGRSAAVAGGRQDRSGPLQMRRSTSMTPQLAAGSGVCPLREPEGEIVLKIRTVPQASPLSLSAGVSLDPLVVEDPGVRRAMSHGDGERSATGGPQPPRLHTTHVRADHPPTHDLCSSPSL